MSQKMYQIYTHDVYDFNDLPNPLEVGAQPFCTFDKYQIHSHEVVGDLQFKNFTLPYMHISHMLWSPKTDIRLINNIQCNAINFVFFLDANGIIQNTELEKTFYPESGKHYISFTPEGGFYNQLTEKSPIEVFMISLDKDFFKSILTDNSEWNKNILSNLDALNPLMDLSSGIGMSPAMWQIIKNLKSYQSLGIINNLNIQAQALELISLQIEILQNSKASANNDILKPEDIKKLHQLKNYLDENYLNTFSLHELSRLCFLNEFKLKKGFKILFGTTVFGYIRKLKMEHAAKLLSQSVPIAQVAYELGYDYPHHFSVAFKNYMGVNPSFFNSKQ